MNARSDFALGGARYLIDHGQLGDRLRAARVIVEHSEDANDRLQAAQFLRENLVLPPPAPAEPPVPLGRPAFDVVVEEETAPAASLPEPVRRGNVIPKSLLTVDYISTLNTEEIRGLLVDIDRLKPPYPAKTAIIRDRLDRELERRAGGGVMKKLICMLLSVALISTSVPAKVQASWFSDLCGGIFTILSAPIWVFCQDNDFFRRQNPFKKKVWQEQEEKEKQILETDRKIEDTISRYASRTVVEPKVIDEAQIIARTERRFKRFKEYIINKLEDMKEEIVEKFKDIEYMKYVIAKRLKDNPETINNQPDIINSHDKKLDELENNCKETFRDIIEFVNSHGHDIRQHEKRIDDLKENMGEAFYKILDIINENKKIGDESIAEVTSFVKSLADKVEEIFKKI
jgi:hypothetical protein